MNVEVEMGWDERKFQKFQKDFGETTRQALIRVGVQAAKEAAVGTWPFGKNKKAIVKNIESGARKNIVGIPARGFNEIAKRHSPAFPFGKGQWVKLDPFQILRSADEVNKFIEKSRMPNGRVRKFNKVDKAICKESDMRRTLTNRKKLAGVAKGSWLGAGKMLSRRSRGPEPARVGKNFIGWAQRHADKGKAKMRTVGVGKDEVRLISNAPATKVDEIFSDGHGRKAIGIAFRKTLSWYRRAAKRRFQ